MIATQLEIPLARPRGRRRLSQADKLEAYFRENPGRWLPMPELAQSCGSYVIHSVVSKLRRTRYMAITNRMSARDGIQVSEYRYDPALPPPPDVKDPPLVEAGRECVTRAGSTSICQ